MGNYSNRCERIYNCLKDYEYLDIKDAIELGMEKINNIDKFYKEFEEYLKNKNDNISKKILESME